MMQFFFTSQRIWSRKVNYEDRWSA